jgi:hypothetical protein
MSTPTIEITKDAVEQYIRAHPGATQRDIAEALPNNNPVYGSHKFVAHAVSSLRAEGKLPDVERCSACQGALTRGRRNLPLVLIGP